MTATHAREPSLSVFMSNYNHGAYLPVALDALLSQTVLPGRIHVVDDASTDNSAAIIADYARRFPDLITATFLDKNRGCLANINTWLEQDRSEFIFIAAADDRVLPTLFEKSLQLLREHPRAGVCSAYSRVLDREGNDLGRFRSWSPTGRADYIPPATASRLLELYDSWFLGTTTVFRGPALRSVGFDEDLSGFADGFACRVMALRDGVCFIPEDLAYWRRMSTGMAALDLATPSSVQRVIERGSLLMTQTYPELFSPRHVRKWKARWLYWAITSACLGGRHEARDSVSALTSRLSFPKRSLLQAAFWISSVSNATIAKLSYFALTRPGDILPVLARMIADRVRVAKRTPS